MPSSRVNANPDKLAPDWFRDEYMREQVYDKIGRLLDRGFSQVAIAEAVGVSDTAVRRYVRRDRNPTVPSIGHVGSLSPEDVREIRAWYATGNVSQLTLAEEYGVHASTIHRVVHGIAWKDVK